MRLALLCVSGFLLSGSVLCGCYCSHQASDAGALADSGRDGGADSGAIDAGHDAGRDAGPPWIPPPGVCTPPPEWSVNRFPMDNQMNRDQQQADRALLSECYPGEACASVRFTVGADGTVDSTEPDESTTQECADLALLGLCLPTFIDAGEGEARGCGV